MQDHIPSDEMYKYIDCRYTGVVVAAKRARQLMQEDPTNAKGKPLLRAFDDLMQGKLAYRFIMELAQTEAEVGDENTNLSAETEVLPEKEQSEPLAEPKNVL